MITKFKKFLNKVFIFCPKTQEILEFKEELLGVLMEKYAELLASGLNEQQSYEACILSIEDYRDTIKALEKRKSKDSVRTGRTIIALGSIAYIMAVLIIYFSVSFGTGLWSKTWLTFIMGVVVYAICGFGYIYYKSKRSSRFSITRYSILLLTMLVSTLVYLVSSLISSAWNMTWLTYLAAAVVWFILDIAFRIKYHVKEYRDIDTVIITALATVLLYLTVSFTTKQWAWSWLIILGGIFVGLIVIIIRKALALHKNTSAYSRLAEFNKNAIEQAQAAKAEAKEEEGKTENNVADKNV